MSFAHLAHLRHHTGEVSRDPLPVIAEALGSVLLLHREIMAERDHSQGLLRQLGDLQQALAELRSYSELLEREVARMKLAQKPDVEGWQ